MRIYLRPVNIDDGKMIVKWRNSESVRNHCFGKRTITEESNRKFYFDYVETGKYKQYIVNRVDDEYGVVSYAIASVYLKDIDADNQRCELCIFTSDDEEWNSNSQSLAIKELLNRAFNEFNMHKVYSYVFAANHDEIDLLKSAGFVEEAELKEEAVNLNGEYVDVIRMSVFAPEKKID